MLGKNLHGNKLVVLFLAGVEAVVTDGLFHNQMIFFLEVLHIVIKHIHVALAYFPSS